MERPLLAEQREPLIVEEDPPQVNGQTRNMETAEPSGILGSILACCRVPREWLWNRNQKSLSRGANLEKAAALIDLAADGNGLPREVLDQPNFATAARHFYTFKLFDPLWYGNLVLMLALNFVEIPVWCKGEAPTYCGDPKKFHLGQVPYLGDRELLGTEIISLFILAGMTFFPILYMTRRFFWRSPVHVAIVVVFLLLVFDIALNCIQFLGHVHMFDSVPRLAPYIRVVVVILAIKDVREFTGVLLRIVPEFLNMLSLVLLYLVITGWLSFIVFQGSLQGREVFPTFTAAFSQMNNILNGAGNPDAWLPGYAENRANVLFFVPIVVIDVVFLYSLTLAIVYNAFKSQLASKYKREAADRKAMLSSAFKLIDIEHRGFLDQDQFSAFLEVLNHYRAVPHISPENIQHIFLALDETSDSRISEAEFQDLTFAIALKFERASEPPFLETHFPGIFHSRAFQTLRRAVTSHGFELAVDGVLCINLIVMVLEAYYYIPEPAPKHVAAPGMLTATTKSTREIQWQRLEFVFGWIYIIELLLRILAIGFTNYWQNLLNRFDLFTILAIGISQVSLAIGFGSRQYLVHYLLVLRTIRVARLLAIVPGYTTIMSTALALVPALAPVAGALFCMMALFASLGVQLLGGLVYDGNPDLETTRLKSWGYFDLNFNDYPTAMVTLFQLLMGGPWMVFMEGYEAASHSLWPRVYFLTWTFLGVSFVTNVIIGFVLEAFDIELQVEKEYKRYQEAENGQIKDQNLLPTSLSMGTTLDLSSRRHGHMRARLLSTYDELMRKVLRTLAEQPDGESR